jgi:hypothetical protein
VSTVEEAMAMQDPERGPRDYPPWDDERRILINIIRRQTEKAGGGNYTEGSGGDKTLLKWLLGLSATLVAVSIVGGVSLYGKVSAIEANQVSQQRQLDQLANTVATLRRAP